MSFIVVLLILAIDQVTKYMVVENIPLGSSVDVISNLFNITHVENTGIAFSMFQGNNIFMIALLSVTSVVLFGLIIRHKPTMLKVALSILLGGALGNLMDRIFRGAVIDFLDLHYYYLHFSVFNVADLCIVLGSIILVYYIIRNSGNKKKGNI